MTYEQIVSEVKNYFKDTELDDHAKHLAVEVAITGEGNGVFYIEVKDGKINVEPYTYNDRDVRFNMNADNFMKLVTGKLDPVWAFTSGKLKIDGSVEKALEFKGVLDKIKK
jgi:putative sterol carrier protein